METHARGPRTAVAATLLVLVAGCAHGPATAPGGTVAQINVVPAFLDAWEAVRSAPRPEQLERTRQALLSTHPELFGPEVFGASTALDGNLERLLVEMPRLDPKLRALSERMPGGDRPQRAALRRRVPRASLVWPRRAEPLLQPVRGGVEDGVGEADPRARPRQRCLLPGAVRAGRSANPPRARLGAAPAVDRACPGAPVVDGVGRGLSRSWSSVRSTRGSATPTCVSRPKGRTRRTSPRWPGGSGARSTRLATRTGGR